MDKLLKQLGIFGKKTHSTESIHQQENLEKSGSVQELPGRSRTTNRSASPLVEPLDYTRRYSDCSRAFSSTSLGRTRVRDLSLRNPNIKVTGCSTFARVKVAGHRLKSKDSSSALLVTNSSLTNSYTGSLNELPLISEYSDPFDLKREITEIEKKAVASDILPVAEDDYSVPYELKKIRLTEDMQSTDKPSIIDAQHAKYDDPYDVSSQGDNSIVMSQMAVDLSNGQNRRSFFGELKPTAKVCPLSNNSEMNSSGLFNVEGDDVFLTARVDHKNEKGEIDYDGGDYDAENYMDLQEEDLALQRAKQIQAHLKQMKVSNVDANVNNYDEPWDLVHTQRDLEERLRAMQRFDCNPALVLESERSRSMGEKVGKHHQEIASMSGSLVEKLPKFVEKTDSRPQDGYDKPWDLQPHKKDDRGQDGYDKPWDLKPHLKDERPSQEYEVPWDQKAKNIERDLMAAKRAKDASRNQADGRAAQGNVARPGKMEDTRPSGEYDEPWDQKMKKLVGKAGSESSGQPPMVPPAFQQMQALARLSSASQRSVSNIDKLDPKLPLEQQGWFHGSISRVDAENLLRVHREGSYLVRTSESNRLDFSLSVKSARGFMHMKIVGGQDGRFILGQFSQPFYSIPQMIYHYTVNKLPIKGAEHMSLLYPISNELL